MPWRTAMLRGTRVLARCDASGKLVDDGGRVEIRYRPQDGKAYRAAPANLSVPPHSEILPDDHCGEAAAAAPGGERKPRRAAAAKADAEATDGLPEDGAVVAYTDGACSGNPGPCGLGVVLITAGKARELSEYLGVGTNNIAELTAILRALETADPQLPVVVHTDSQYAIGVLTKGWKPKANQALIQELKTRMKTLPRLKLVYVPGHAGVPLNERADALARASVQARRSAGWREVKGRA